MYLLFFVSIALLLSQWKTFYYVLLSLLDSSFHSDSIPYILLCSVKSFINLSRKNLILKKCLKFKKISVIFDISKTIIRNFWHFLFQLFFREKFIKKKKNIFRVFLVYCIVCICHIFLWFETLWFVSNLCNFSAVQKLSK